MKSIMNREQSMTESEFRANLDRLVSGDLSDHSRKSLLQYLELNPQRWRDCSLAFLEAQLWSESLRLENAITVSVSPEPVAIIDANASSVALMPNKRAPGTFATTQPAPRAWMSLITAALVLVAFISGWLVEKSVQVVSMENAFPVTHGLDEALVPIDNPNDDDSTESSNSKIVWATRELPKSGNLPGARLQIPLDLTQSQREEPEINISNYQRQLLARRGIELATRRQFINASLPDGTTVAVPVDQIVVKRINNEVN